jgi:hypothetical protein
MRSTMLVAMLIPPLLLVGCAKKIAKKPEPPKDETASVKPQTQPNNAKKDDGPNWLTDPRFKKDQTGGDVPFETKDGKNKPLGNVTPPKDGWDNPNVVVQPGTPNPGGMPPSNPVPAPGPPAQPGMGVLQPQQVPQPQPANPTSGTMPKFDPVTRQDMFDLQVFIHDSSLVMGRMPTPLEIYNALVLAKSPAAKLVANGSIMLTGATKRDSVWAYETQAVFQGGFIVSPNGVDTVTAQELKAKLGNR